MAEAAATQQVVIVGAPKSVGISILLTVLFGPLGMLYSTVPGGVIMMVVSLIVAVVTFAVGLFVTWPICVVWGAMAASAHNKKLGEMVQAKT
jgi:hypothetical protein